MPRRRRRLSFGAPLRRRAEGAAELHLRGGGRAARAQRARTVSDQRVYPAAPALHGHGRLRAPLAEAGRGRAPAPMARTTCTHPSCTHGLSQPRRCPAQRDDRLPQPQLRGQRGPAILGRRRRGFCLGWPWPLLPPWPSPTLAAAAAPAEPSPGPVSHLHPNRCLAVPSGPSPRRSLRAAVICEPRGGGDARMWAARSVRTPLARAARPSGDALICRLIAGAADTSVSSVAVRPVSSNPPSKAFLSP